MHVSPQTDPTSLTHCESHEVLQQNESTAQMLAAQVSHDPVSLAPVEQMAWAQVPPPQVWWHTDETSPTQTESHELLQQNESAVQI